MMTGPTFDRALEDWLQAEAPVAAPQGVHAAAIEVARTARQRPAWLVTVRGGAIGAPDRPLLRRDPRVRYLVLAAALLVALIAATIVGGGVRPSKSELATSLVRIGGLPLEAGWPIALALSDGRIVVGGYGTGQAIAYVIDPADGETLDLDSGLSSVSLEGGAMLPDGRVFLLGWDHHEPVIDGRSLAWVLDPSTGTLSEPVATRQSRFESAVGLLSDGRVSILGGLTNPESGLTLASTEIFDTASRSFVDGPDLSFARMEQITTSLPGGDLLLVGGITVDAANVGSPIPGVERFDPIGGASRAVAPAVRLVGRANPPMTTLPDGRVLIISAGDLGTCGRHGIDAVRAWFFDPTGDTLTPAPGLPHAVHAAAALPDGRVAVAGGWQAIPGGCGGGGKYVSDGWIGIYDPATGITIESRNPITGEGTLPVDTSVDFAAAALLPDGRVALVSGSGGATEVAVLTVAPR